jgi:pimeloyl-ACP methyl ester carboxylesterase
MIRGASGPRKRWSDRELDAYSEVLKQSSRARASTSCYRTFLTRELAEAALAATGPATCGVPALLAMGSASPLRRAFVPRQRQGLRVLTIPSAGHFVLDEAPGEVFKLAKGWA